MSIKKRDILKILESIPDDADILAAYDGYWYPVVECTIEVMDGVSVALIDFEPFPGACKIQRES